MKPKKRTPFGRICRELREDRGVFQKHMAKEFGLSNTYLGQLEAGERRPTEIHLKQIIQFFECSPKERRRLTEAFYISQPFFKVEMENKTEEQKKLTVFFLKNFTSLSAQDSEQALETLKGLLDRK